MPKVPHLWKRQGLVLSGSEDSSAMVEHYSKSLTFDDALQLYKQVNGSELCGYLEALSELSDV